MIRSYRVAYWLKSHFFKTKTDAVISIVLISILAKFLTDFNNWIFFESVWSGTNADCQVSGGACLAFLKDKFNFIIFANYPHDEIWRPFSSMVLFLVSLIVILKKPQLMNKYRKMMGGLIVVIVVVISILMKGGLLGLLEVPSQQWGGLPLTLILSTLGVLFAYPLGILLALARNSSLKIIKLLSILYIELIRGIPFISILFIFSLIFPLFLPEGMALESKVIRMVLAIIFFMSAYMAEVVRGGLASVSRGQYEASYSLGLSHIQTTLFIVLPQALKTVLPCTVNTVISMFKDTSLVFIFSMFDLLGAAKITLKDPLWGDFSLELYLFLALIYFIFCFSMGQYAKKFEIQQL